MADVALRVTVRLPASDSVELFAAVHESAIGPKRTSLVAHMSAFGGKVDIAYCTANVRF